MRHRQARRCFDPGPPIPQPSAFLVTCDPAKFSIGPFFSAPFQLPGWFHCAAFPYLKARGKDGPGSASRLRIAISKPQRDLRPGQICLQAVCREENRKTGELSPAGWQFCENLGVGRDLPAKKKHPCGCHFKLVRKKGLEPLRLSVLAPEASASTNSATFARSKFCWRSR